MAQGVSAPTGGSLSAQRSSLLGVAELPTLPIAKAVSIFQEARVMPSAPITSVAVPVTRALTSTLVSGPVSTQQLVEVAVLPNAMLLNTGANKAPPLVPTSTAPVPE